MTLSRPARLRALLVFVAVAFALLAGELVCRLLPASGAPGASFLQCDRRLGWRGIPNDRFDLKFPDGDVRIVRNSRGMHDREHATELAAGTFRVLYLGDSYVESLQVPESLSHHQLVEDAFAGRLDVVNAGIGGWSLGQELLYFEDEGAAYRPGLVVLFWYVGNDLWDVQPAGRYQTCRGENCYSPYFVLRNGSLEPWSAALGAPVGRPDLYRPGRRIAARILAGVETRSVLARRLAALLPVAGTSPLFASDAPWRPERQAPVEYAWRITEALLERLKGDVAATGGKLAIVVVPFNRAVEGDLAQAEWNQSNGGPSLQPSDARRPNERMQALATRLGLPVMDLHAAFLANLARDGPQAFWPDSHWTRAGNRIAATAIESWLRSSELVPR